MTLLEALAKKSEAPIEIISGVAVGRKFRWHRGHIQTQTATSEFWNDCTNISALILARADKVKIKGNDMVEKIDIDYDSPCRLRQEYGKKINEIIDDLHELKALYKEYDKSFTAAIESINVHERQIDKLQMMLEPNKCEPAENRESSKMEQDPYAEQRRWIGKLCRFWDDDAFVTSNDWAFGILTSIDKGMQFQYCCNENCNFKHCEPVKPDDDIIYKGGNDE